MSDPGAGSLAIELRHISKRFGAVQANRNVSLSIPGATIHGVTREVTVPLDATTADGLLFVVGSLDVALADHDIDTPSAPRVAGVSRRCWVTRWRR